MLNLCNHSSCNFSSFNLEKSTLFHGLSLGHFSLLPDLKNLSCFSLLLQSTFFHNSGNSWRCPGPSIWTILFLNSIPNWYHSALKCPQLKGYIGLCLSDNSFARHNMVITNWIWITITKYPSQHYTEVETDGCTVLNFTFNFAELYIFSSTSMLLFVKYNKYF